MSAARLTFYLRGYGIVLKAMQKSTGQMVAIKQFRDSDSYVSYYRFVACPVSSCMMTRGR